MSESVTDIYIRAWVPSQKRPHCNNCQAAKVRGDPEHPETYCEAGHGKAQPLPRLLRPLLPHGFRMALECPDYDAEEAWRDGQN